MTSPDELPQGWQQMLDQIDEHGAAQQPDPPPAPIVVTFWIALVSAWLAVFWAFGYVLGVLQ